jgi:hypothetical protein
VKHAGAILALVVVLIGAFQLSRPGYSVDEEFTIFAVRGISATGLPVLPSGLLYDRGLAYSYASWFASLLPGDDLVAARVLSLISVALTLILIFIFLNRQFASERFALLATIAAASSISFWAAATTARFYGPFLLTYVAALLCLQRRSWIALLVVAMFSRWTHELAFTMLAIPALGLLLAEREERGRWLKTGLAIGFGLLIAQVLILALHYTVPSNGDTMIRRFFVWQVLNLFQRPPDRQFAIPLVVMVIAWLVAPKRAFLSTAAALCGAAFIIGMSRGALANGSRYPLDMFWSLVTAAPLLTLVTLCALIGRVIGLGGDWPLVERAFHFMWIGWVIWFGIIESGITLNYQLLPVTMMMLAVTVDLYAISRERKVSFAATTLVVILICGNQWGAHWFGETLAAARPTIQIEGIEDLRASLQPSDRVACTDELACLLLVGRDDAWLALDDFVRERFVVIRKDYSGVGVYGGAPAAFRPSELFGDLGDKKTPARVLIVDVFKEYPVGNSRTWLPRALAQDGIEGKILLETPQARVVQISAPIRNAQIIP